FRNQYGTTPEYKTITQYGALQTNLAAGTADWFDTSTPRTNDTAARARGESNTYLPSHGTYNSSTIYEVVIPSSSYSSSGSSDSCGGPSLADCAHTGSSTR